jgi:hypothetical protein
MLIGSVNAICNPAISDLSAGCAAAPTASPARPAEAIKVSPRSRTPGIDSSIRPTVTKTIRKPPIREKIASRVRRRRACWLSAGARSAFSAAAWTKACRLASAIQPISAGITKPASFCQTSASSGVSRAASTSPSATIA